MHPILLDAHLARVMHPVQLKNYLKRVTPGAKISVRPTNLSYPWGVFIDNQMVHIFDEQKDAYALHEKLALAAQKAAA